MRFIAIEGIDGSGKSTCARELGNRLRDEWDVTTRVECEPSKDTVLGKLVRRKFKEGHSPEMHALLFAADRVEHTNRLKNTTEDVVICDRYLMSNIVYQRGGSISPQWIEIINKFAYVPDLYIYLRVAPETAMRRILSRGGTVHREENIERLTELSQYFDQAAGVYEAEIVDANNSQEEVIRDAVDLIVSKGLV